VNAEGAEAVPILDIPDVRQKAAADCGPACVVAVARFFGLRLALPEATGALLTTDHNGTDPSAIEAYLRRLGLRVVAGEMSKDDLKAAARLGRPVICVTAGHYVVSAGFDRRGRVRLMDPEAGPSRVPWLDFAATWADRHRWGALYDQFGLAVWRG
jgi:ABC-type bacteriocin/lantibiotic exporter with double-glycine peptidase domain